jgi:hypothetical protein
VHTIPGCLDTFLQEAVSNFKKEDLRIGSSGVRVYKSRRYHSGCPFHNVSPLQLNADPLDLYRILRGSQPSPTCSLFFSESKLCQRSLSGYAYPGRKRYCGVSTNCGNPPKGESYEEDELLIKEQKADPKEIAEHVMRVRSGRYEVGRVCELDLYMFQI